MGKSVVCRWIQSPRRGQQMEIRGISSEITQIDKGDTGVPLRTPNNLALTLAEG